MKKLNLGCGANKVVGCINVDMYGNPDIKHNLDEYPYPFENDSVDEIYAFHLLEHLSSPLGFLMRFTGY